MSAERLAKCFWCWRKDCPASEWEQEHHHGGWQRLCRRCAGQRLRNPWNALLSMRKVAAIAQLEAGSGT